MAPSLTWSEWIYDIARVPGDTYSAWVGNEYRFPSDQGLIVVHEEGPAGRSGSSTRARCTTSGKEYDLRRLRAGADAGGLVTLEALEALEREAKLARKAGVHPHALRCHSALIENVGGSHCRLLLCDPCSTDLGAHLKAHDDKLRPSEIVQVGQHLAFGLGHLHSLSILFGSMMPAGIVRGHDGLWKLGGFHRSAELPLTALEWRNQCVGAECAFGSLDEVPPEARVFSDADMWPEADVWLLGHLLAVMLLKEAGGAVTHGAEKGSTVLSAPTTALEEPLVARMWVLLHWLLASEPSDRPNANESAALVSTVGEARPEEILEEMPPYARRHCTSVAVAAARQLAVDEAVRAAADTDEHDRLVRCLAGLPLSKLRKEIPDTSRVDRLCDNCGVQSEEAE
uniref:Protein kinase domain-containing protein n=1 Tax=Alexandrium monilatum TaxID=311494 RepID=A0A7S4QGR4_9DINO